MDIILRALEDCDFDDYICLQKEVYFDKSLLETDSQKKSTWDSVMNSAGRYYAIMEQNSQRFLGCCAINNKEAHIPEISVEILEIHRRKGVGYQAVCALMRKTSIETHKKCFWYRVEPDNYESLLLVRKLNGQPVKLERNIFK